MGAGRRSITFAQPSVILVIFVFAGILEAGEEDGEGGPDEILTELQRCQEELKAVAQHNQAQLRRLVKSAREEMARQEIRNRCACADTSAVGY